MSKPQLPLDLKQIASRTLSHYAHNAEAFREGTWDHDVSQNYAAMLDALGERQGLRILELPVGYRPRIGQSKISGTVRGTLRAGSKILYSTWRYA